MGHRVRVGSGEAVVRLVAAALLTMLAPAAIPSAAAAEGHRFTVGEPRSYTYVVEHRIEWASIDDRVRFVQRFELDLALLPQAVSNERVDLKVLVTGVRGRLQGPGLDEVFAAGDSPSDHPRLGLLAIFDGLVVDLALDPATGAATVAAATSDALVARVNERRPSPNRMGFDPPPLDAAARRAYAPERLSALWSRLFALPVAGVETVALGPPLSGSLERRWQGADFTVHPGPEAPSLVLTTVPEPIELAVTELEGAGRVDLRDGVLVAATERLRFTVAGIAFTQGVTQRHEVVWDLALRGRPPP